MVRHILLLRSIGTQETMKRQWRVRRMAAARPDSLPEVLANQSVRRRHESSGIYRSTTATTRGL